MDIHDRIRIRRKELGLTPAQLGEAGGVSYQAAQQWELPEGENGTAPTRARLAAVADRLKLSLSCLVAGDGWEERNVPITSASGEITEVPAVSDVARLAHDIFTLIQPFLDDDVKADRNKGGSKVFVGIKYPSPRGSATLDNKKPDAAKQTQPNDAG